MRLANLPATLLLLLLGWYLLYNWHSQQIINRGATPTPVAITYEELSKGRPDNPFRILGAHEPVYALVLYNADGDAIKSVWYPIAAENQVGQALARIETLHPEGSAPPTEREMTSALNIRILVLTRRYESVHDLQTSLASRDFPNTMTGMVLENWHLLSESDQRFIAQGYPLLDLDHTVIFVEGAQPTAEENRAGLLMAGGGSILLGLLVLVRPARKGGSSASD